MFRMIGSPIEPFWTRSGAIISHCYQALFLITIVSFIAVD